jgi:cytochrome c-type biogenesis protein
MHALVFVLGFGIVFTLLGASVGLLAATVGSDDQYFVRDHEDVLAKIAGVVLIVMGLNLVGVIKVPWLYRTYSFEGFGASPHMAAVAAGAGGGSGTIAMGGGGDGWGGMRYAKSLGVGAAFAVGWVPCIGPVLGAIFGLAAEAGDVAKGAYLLMVYSLGLGVPFVITGMAVVPVTTFLRKYRPVLPLVEILMGTLVIFVGALIFLDELTVFNRYFDFFGFSQI